LENGKVLGYKVGSGEELIISHLQFADDMINIGESVG
jgi:hypothetical protein